MVEGVGDSMIQFGERGRALISRAPEMPVLWYLRDVPGLTGTRFGCGVAFCGACTVHKSGGVRSCVVPVRTVAGAEITTIEGIAENRLQPVQKAWMEFSVPRCGYCQAWQIMHSIALLNSKRRPSDQAINESMSRNICRCGTYQRIRARIKAAAMEIS